jgi:hypothetical protein
VYILFRVTLVIPTPPENRRTNRNIKKGVANIYLGIDVFMSKQQNPVNYIVEIYVPMHCPNLCIVARNQTRIIGKSSYNINSQQQQNL